MNVLVPQVSVGGCNGVDKHMFTVDFLWRKLLFEGPVASSKYQLLSTPLLSDVEVRCNLRAL